MTMSASLKDPKKYSDAEFKQQGKPEPYSNITQEKVILAQLKKTNPEAYKLLKNYAIK